MHLILVIKNIKDKNMKKLFQFYFETAFFYNPNISSYILNTSVTSK